MKIQELSLADLILLINVIDNLLIDYKLKRSNLFSVSEIEREKIDKYKAIRESSASRLNELIESIYENS